MTEQAHRPHLVPSARADTTLADRLANWLDCFHDGSAQWGLVDYWRDDGSKYTRHGIVLTLTADLPTQMEESRFSRLREAIDLVLLVLAVQPSVIVSLLGKLRQKYWSHRADSTEELEAITRGVPVQVRLCFRADGLCMTLKKNYFTFATIRAFDSKLSTNDTFMALRRELLTRVENENLKLIQLNNQTVLAVLSVGSNYENSEDATTGSTVADFLEVLAAFANLLAAKQRSCDRLTAVTPFTSRHALFAFEKITLGSCDVSIFPSVIASVTKLMDTGVPVDWGFLTLDLRRIHCDEDQLRTFVESVAKKSSSLLIDTIHVSYHEFVNGKINGIDEYGRDCRALIRMVLRAMASTRDHVSALDLGGLLRLCEEDENREEIWCGLFEDVLSPEIPLERLLFDSEAVLNENDTAWIEQYASTWKVNHPDKRLCVKRLELRLNWADVDALSAILFAFDDVEEIEISHSPSNWPLSRDLFDDLLAFPSLRKLRVVNVAVPTMDIFDPTILDEDFPLKSMLEELQLEQIVLEDVPSLSRFFASLNPSISSSPLVSSLRKLHVTQRDSAALNPVDFYDSSTLTALTDMLVSNHVLRDVTVTDAGDASMVDQWAKLFSQGVRYLPTPLECRETALVKACSAAFVSVTYAASGKATYRLDVPLICHILEFSAPVVTRTINKLLIEKR